MFVIFFSIVTGGFPPDFKRLGRAYDSIQGMSKLSKAPVKKYEENVAEETPATPSASGFEEEKEIAELEKYNKKRADLGEGMTGGVAPAPAGSMAAATVTATGPSRTVSSAAPQEELKNQMREMRQELFRLQQRVNDLEEQLHKTPTK